MALLIPVDSLAPLRETLRGVRGKERNKNPRGPKEPFRFFGSESIKSREVSINLIPGHNGHGDGVSVLSRVPLMGGGVEWKPNTTITTTAVAPTTEWTCTNHPPPPLPEGPPQDSPLGSPEE